MKICVTGASGFVGLHLVRRLDHDVFTIRRSDVDLLDGKSLSRCFALHPQFDVVIHLAAVVGGIGFNQRNPKKCLQDNLAINLNLFQAMEVKPPKKLIALGSVCAYPKYTPTPFDEDDLWNGYPEETNAPYGIAKRVLLSQCQASGIPFVYLLPANMYGPNDHYDLQDSHVIPAIIRKMAEAKDDGSDVHLWGSGNATRDFLFVDDCVDAIIAALDYESVDPVNIGTGRETSIKEVAIIIAKLVGVPTSRIQWDATKPDGQPSRVLNASRAKEFGFTAKTSLEEGLRQTVYWYLRQ